jgi:predicted ATPase
MARVVGITVDAGQSPAQRIADWIGDKAMLFVLDNFEQVLGAAKVVSDLLIACPRLKVICTSRSALKVAGEQEYEVPGLPSPPDYSRLSLLERENLPESNRHPAPESLNQYEAVRLFIARAMSVNPNFLVTNLNAPAVAQICSHLNGMPLAIELAAARIKVLSPSQILERLENRLALLTSSSRDRPERQRTLRGAIAWSFDLLDEPRRVLASRLSVFNGGWDLEAAEAVAGSDNDSEEVLIGLEALVDHSLVRREDVDGVVRFDMFPTIREFMAEALGEMGDSGQSADRHTNYYLRLAEKAAPHLHGDEQREWMDRLEREHDNLRAALDRATTKPDPEPAVRLAFAMWRFWQQRGYLREARRRLQSLLNQGWDMQDVLRARLLEAAGGIAYWQADHPATVKWYLEALQIWRRLGDKAELANAIYNYVFATLLPAVSGSVATADELAAGVDASMEALQLYRDVGNRLGEANVMWALGSLHFFAGRDQESRQWFDRARTGFAAVGQRTMEAWANYMSALPLVRLGEIEEAGRLGRRALRHFHDAGDLPGVAQTIRKLSAIAIINRDRPKAGRLHGAAEKLLAATGAGLTGYYEAILAEYDPTTVLTEEELSRFTAEGAEMPLGDVVRLAMEPDKPKD